MRTMKSELSVTRSESRFRVMPRPRTRVFFVAARAKSCNRAVRGPVVPGNSPPRQARGVSHMIADTRRRLRSVPLWPGSSGRNAATTTQDSGSLMDDRKRWVCDALPGRSLDVKRRSLAAG
jgi:hypothetical protein